MLKYKFLSYVASGNGIKFGLSTDPTRTLRFDHHVALAPSSTKQNPLSVLRNSITLNDRISIQTCDKDCGVRIPRVATLSWSTPVLATAEQKVEQLDIMISVLKQYREQLNGGFLPSTDDIDLTITTGA